MSNRTRQERNRKAQTGLEPGLSVASRVESQMHNQVVTVAGGQYPQLGSSALRSGRR
jgi:hypothetical protein